MEGGKQGGLLITARMLGLDRNRLQLCLSPHDEDPETLEILRAPVALASVEVDEVEVGSHSFDCSDVGLDANLAKPIRAKHHLRLPWKTAF